MTVFVDTSAIIATMVCDDIMHTGAAAAWDHLLSSSARMATTNYVIVEACSVLQRRHGPLAVAHLRGLVTPVVAIHWVTREQHDAAFAALLAANRRDLSLVDCVSFAVMRETGIDTAFAFDRHFGEQGFRVLPD